MIFAILALAAVPAAFLAGMWAARQLDRGESPVPQPKEILASFTPEPPAKPPIDPVAELTKQDEERMFRLWGPVQEGNPFDTLAVTREKPKE